MSFRLITGVALMVGGATWPCVADAQTFTPTGRETLRALPGIEVAIENVPLELLGAGLTTAALRKDVEQRLRAGGMTVYATQHENPSSAKPYLYIHLNALRIDGHVQAVAVQVHVRQTLRSLVTNANIVNAMTWDAHNLVALTGPDLRPLKDLVLEMVDDFIADWRAVH